MSGFRRVYLDANIVIPIFEGTDATSDLLRDLLVHQADRQVPFFCTSALTLAEALVHPIRNQDDALVSLYTGWFESNPLLEVGPVDRDVLLGAARIRAGQRAMKMPDAIHLATAGLFGCSHFLTADSRLPASISFPQTRDDAAPMTMIAPSEDVLLFLTQATR